MEKELSINGAIYVLKSEYEGKVFLTPENIKIITDILGGIDVAGNIENAAKQKKEIEVPKRANPSQMKILDFLNKDTNQSFTLEQIYKGIKVTDEKKQRTQYQYINLMKKYKWIVPNSDDKNLLYISEEGKKIVSATKAAELVQGQEKQKTFMQEAEAAAAKNKVQLVKGDKKK